jgi:uncharacterized protein with HEPN domain
MATRAPLLRIHDMLESIRGIEKALAGKTIRDYERSWLLRSAVERGIEVISEASRHLGRDLKVQHRDVRWKDIAGIGNICGTTTSALTPRLSGKRSKTICHHSRWRCSRSGSP